MIYACSLLAARICCIALIIRGLCFMLRLVSGDVILNIEEKS